MGWIYFQELVGLAALSASGCGQSPIVNLTDTVRASYCHECDQVDLSTAPIHDDVRSLVGKMLPKIDIVYGGFPCQDISVAGAGRGLAGERSGLVFELLRLVGELRPTFVFLENVPAIRTRGGETVGKELARRGYDCRWLVVSAAEVGAPHLRKRWFALAANADSCRRAGERAAFDDNGCDAPRDLADGLVESSRRAWADQSKLERVAYGVPRRLHRIRVLGNSVVPAQAREAFKKLIGMGD